MCEDVFSERERRLFDENKSRPTPSVLQSLIQALPPSAEYDRAITLKDNLVQASRDMKATPPALHLLNVQTWNPCKQQVSKHRDSITAIEDVDREEEVVSLPHNIPQFVSCLSATTYDEKVYEMLWMLQSLAKNDNARQQIEVCTRGQSTNPRWYHYRTGLISDSIIKRIINYTIHKKAVPDNALKVILKRKDCASQTAACQWGSSHEEIAISTFVANFEEVHQLVKIQRPGLIIHPSFGYLGASPDAILSCACCRDKILLCTPQEAVANGDITYITQHQDGFVVKPGHSRGYYEQIQLTMACSQLQKAKMLVWITKDILDVDMNFDSEFFFKTIVP